jgi:hypothetical protein
VRSFDPISYRFLAGSQMPERLTPVCAIHGFRSHLASAGVIDWKVQLPAADKRTLLDHLVGGDSLTAVRSRPAMTYVKTADDGAAFPNV